MMPRADDALPPTLAGWHQPALALALGHGLGLDNATLLAGTGLDAQHDAAPSAATLGRTRWQAQHYLRVLANLLRAIDSADLPFLLGRQSLPGHFGAASHALAQAGNLRQALDVLVRTAPALTPLLTPRVVVQAPWVIVYWMPTCALSWLKPALIDMHHSALVAFTRQRAGQRLPWTCCFNRTRPRCTEAHEAHLGERLRFDCLVDGLLIDAAWLDTPWPAHDAVRAAAAIGALDHAPPDERPAPGLLALLYDHLLATLAHSPTLESTAAHIGLSPATLKRRLAAHGTHFQAELDQVRSHLAMYLMVFHDYDNDALASRLGFHDGRNFRRSFKRWTGLTPRLLLDALQPAF